MKFSLDGLGYNDIYKLQCVLEEAMCVAATYPKWMEELHMSIINFWELEEVHQEIGYNG